MKKVVLITGLLILLLANFIMLYVAPYGVSPMEGFASMNGKKTEAFQNAPMVPANAPMVATNAPAATNGSI
jgi:hypothetical protein